MTWLWNATRERPRSSRPIVASRNGWLFSMSPFSVKAHWIVSVIGLISSSLMGRVVSETNRTFGEVRNPNAGNPASHSENAGICERSNGHRCRPRVKKPERNISGCGAGACGNCRNYGKKQNATLLFPTVAWISRAIKRARLIHSYHRAPMIYPSSRTGITTQKTQNKEGGLPYVI